MNFARGTPRFDGLHGLPPVPKGPDGTPAQTQLRVKLRPIPEPEYGVSGNCNERV